MKKNSVFISTIPFLIIILINLWHFLLAPTFGLTPQEAYYFFYSQHLALSYFDHPPMIAYFLHLFTILFGKTEMAIRLCSLTLTLLTQVVFYILAKKFLGKRNLPKAMILFSTSIMVLILSMVSSPDVPLILFWTLTLNSLYNAIFRNKIYNWILAGILAGLSFDSKYTGAFLQIGLFLFLVFHRKYRFYFKIKWPYLFLLLAHLTMLPVYIWNFEHDFASFSFQSTHRVSEVSGLNLKYFIALIITQSVLLLPILFGGLISLSVKYLKRVTTKGSRIHPKILFLLSFFFPPFLGFLSFSLFGLVKLNWLMPAYVTGIILASIFLNIRLVKWNLALSIILQLFLTIQVLFYPIPIRSNDTWFGWRELAVSVKKLQKQYPEAFIFSADDYKTTAELSFYLNQKVFGANILGEPALEYNYIGDNLKKLAGRDAIYINSAPYELTKQKAGVIPPELAKKFYKVKELKPILIYSHGRIMRKFHVYYCQVYKS